MLDLDSAADKEAADKVRRCAIDLLVRAPLFGFTLLGHAVKVREAPRSIPCDTMCTDGRYIWYSPAWVHKKTSASITFDLLHELLHVFGNHVMRGGKRDRRIWGYAIDVRVAHDGLAIMRAKGDWQLDPDHIAAHPWAYGLTCEGIYEHLLKNADKVPVDFKPDIMDGQLPPDEERDFLRVFTQDLAQATMAEEQANPKESIEKRYGKAVWDRLQEIRKCEVPWHVLLQGRLAAATGQTHHSWIPPNKRWFPMIALPSVHGRIEDELILGIDVSGSIKEDDIKVFRGCIMPAAQRAKKTTVITFDMVNREIRTSTRPHEVLAQTKFSTGSHSYTSVEELFEEVDQRKPSALAIITDGHIRLPKKRYPKTHWVITPNGVFQPWGVNYRMRPSW